MHEYMYEKEIMQNAHIELCITAKTEKKKKITNRNCLVEKSPFSK